MFRISIYDYFSSAHQLRGYKGKCENVHGHNWKVEVEIEGSKLDDIGLLMDFTELKSILKGTLDKLDHKMLNDIPPFDKLNPSSELLSKFIHETLGKEMPEGINITSTSVWESERARATYFSG